MAEEQINGVQDSEIVTEQHVDEDEELLCENFQNGQVLYLAFSCFHVSCLGDLLLIIC